MIRIDEIPEYIENNKLYPNILYKSFERNNTNDLCDMFVYRHDEKMLLTNDFLKSHAYISHDDGSERIIKNINDNLSYNYYYKDKDIYSFKKDVITYVLNHGSTYINLATYFKKEKPTNIFVPTFNHIDLNIKNIGNTYGYFESDKTLIIDDVILLLTNLYRKDYNKIYNTIYQLNWFINDNCWITTGKQIGEMESLISSFSQEGFRTPLCMVLDKDYYYPLSCNCRWLASYYLNLPMIPVCIIITNRNNEYNKSIILER